MRGLLAYIDSPQPSTSTRPVLQRAPRRNPPTQEPSLTWAGKMKSAQNRDYLLAQIHAVEAAPPATAPGPAVTRVSLQADLLAASERAVRLTSRIRQLESRLSEALGEQAWYESGLGAPADSDALNQKINHLEQQSVELRMQIAERDQDLAAARAANRELMAQLNTAVRHR